MADEPEFIQQRKFYFNTFIEERSGFHYASKIQEMVDEGRNRLVVNINDIRSHNKEEAQHLLDRPMDCLPAFEAALKQFVEQNKDPSSKTQTFDRYHVAIEGSFGSHRLGPREMLADSLTHLVCVEGIVTKCSLVRPKVMKTVHYCPKTGQFQSQNYRDATSFGHGVPTGSAYPKTDEEGNALTTEYGLCNYKNSQTIYIQDMPERTDAGTMPRTVECIVEDDLVDNCKPGDRVQMIGVYRALANKAQGESSGRFKTVIIANNIRRIGRDEARLGIQLEDIENFKELRKNHKKDLFDIIARSLAPTIYGHDDIKKAVALMLLGGCEKNLTNGTHIRGDINILMVGDPSTAKSQLLRAVMQAGELVINTTGRGSSGAGLTAAVTTDRDTGERRLEAGAMVLADRGIVCIDEFDKMSDADRTAIHEVMEQQTVTIAKAGIHTSLNARCSVIAASNPIYGQYSRNMTPAQNIALPDSLLSRFDLLFIVLDKLDPRIDRAISDHVLRMHRYQGKESQEAEFDESDDDDEDKVTEMYEKRDKLLQGAAASLRKGSKKKKYLTADFVRKYVRYAKQKAVNNPPKLTNEARESIAQRYSEFRMEDSVQTLPITARCLETLIRLASAHAKLRISQTVEVEDVDAVAKVLMYALTNDAAPVDPDAPSREVEMDEEEDGLEEEDEGGMEVDGEERARVVRKRSKPKRKKPMDHASPEKRKKKKAGAAVDPAKTAEVMKCIVEWWRKNRTQSYVMMKDIIKELKKIKPSYTDSEVEGVVKNLAASEKVFLTEGKIYRL